ncbi:MAG TPA: ribonuclease P protein component [Terracidiphilus sp.]
MISLPVLDSKAAPPNQEVVSRHEHFARAFFMNAPSKPAQRQTLVNSRLRKHADYVRAYATGRKRHSAAMSWFLAPQTTGGIAGSRVGLTVGKVIGKAHERNRIKRRMRDALRRHVDLLPAGFDLILHPRRVVLTMDFAQLEQEVLRILEQAGSEAARPQKHPAAAARTAR